MSHLLPEQTLGCIATDYGSSPSPDRSPGPAHYYWTGHSTANIRYQVAAVSHLLHSAHAVRTHHLDRPCRHAKTGFHCRTNGRKRRGDISQSPGNICFIKRRQHHIAKRTWIIQQHKRIGSPFLQYVFRCAVPVCWRGTQVQCLKGRRTMGGYHQIHFLGFQHFCHVGITFNADIQR